MRKNRYWKDSEKLIKMLAFTAVLTVILSGCGSNSSKEMANDSIAETEYAQQDGGAQLSEETGIASDTEVLSANSIQTERKLIKNVHLDVETKEYDSLMQVVSGEVKSLGGYVEESSVNGSNGTSSYRSGTMTIRIPAEKLDAFVKRINENSNVVYTSESASDVTLNYVDMESHVKALRIEQETLLGLLERAEKLEDIVTIQTQLTQVRYEIESYESQLKVLDNQVAYSTIYLNIREVERETLAQEKGFFSEVKAEFTNNLYLVGDRLRTAAIWFLGSLPAIIAWAAVLAAAFIGIRMLLKGRKFHASKKEKFACHEEEVWKNQFEAEKPQDKKEQEDSGDGD